MPECVQCCHTVVTKISAVSGGRQFALLETFTTAIYDTFPATRNRKVLVTFLAASSCFLIGLPCVSQVCCGPCGSLMIEVVMHQLTKQSSVEVLHRRG